MDFGQKKIREIDLFDFTSFFFGLDFFKFSGQLCKGIFFRSDPILQFPDQIYIPRRK